MITDVTANTMLDSITLDLVSLHSAFSATGLNTLSTSGTPAYANKTASFAAASSRSRAVNSATTFDVASGSTVAFVGVWTAAGSVFRGMTPNGGSEKSFQVDVASNRIYCEGHGMVDTDRVAFLGGAPTGLTEGAVLHVVGTTAGDPDYFQVSSSSAGAAIDITGQAAATARVSRVVLETFASQGTHQITAATISL